MRGKKAKQVLRVKTLCQICRKHKAHYKLKRTSRPICRHCAADFPPEEYEETELLRHEGFELHHRVPDFKLVVT